MPHDVSYKYIKLDRSERILTIFLDRPSRLNALNFPMLDELQHALGVGNDDDDIRAVIVTGSGRAFSAGTDLAAGSDTYNGNAADSYHADSGIPRDAGGRITLRLFDYRKPLIAAVNGPAVGFGATITLPMDVRIASVNAKFGFVFTRRGLVPEACSTWFLPRLVGIQQALDWVQTGRVFDVEEARVAGLVREVIAPDELLPRARAIARNMIDETSAPAMSLARRMMWRMLGADHPMEAHRLESRAMHTLRALPDFQEGVAAFLEKRPPRFTSNAKAASQDSDPWWDDRTYAEA